MNSQTKIGLNLGKLATTPGRETEISIRKKNILSLEAKETSGKTIIKTPANPKTTSHGELFETKRSTELKGSHNPGN